MFNGILCTKIFNINFLKNAILLVMRSSHLHRHIVVRADLHRAPLRPGGAAVGQQVAVVSYDHRPWGACDVAAVVIVQELPFFLVLNNLAPIVHIDELNVDCPRVDRF